MEHISFFMKDSEFKLFSAVLHIKDPFIITNIVIDEPQKRVNVYVGFVEDPIYTCPECGKETSRVHAVREKVWRHLNLFEYQCFVHCQTPRIFCEHCKKTLDIKLPWVNKHSGFSLMMEGLILNLSKVLPFSTVGRLLEETDKRIARTVDSYVNRAIKKKDLSDVKTIGIDETSVAKGHKYITTVSDLDKGEVIFVTSGKDADTLKAFEEYFVRHNGKITNITNVCSDMSKAFISGIKEVFSNAIHTIDKFHVMMAINDFVNNVRKNEQTTNDVLKKTKFVFLKNPQNLTKTQRARLTSLTKLNLKTVRAYQIRLNFQEFWKCNSREEGEIFLKKWYYWLTHSRLYQKKELATTIKNHWDGILNYFSSKITNGRVEGINGEIQKVKREARGYKNINNFKNAILLRFGNLDFDIPLIHL